MSFSMQEKEAHLFQVTMELHKQLQEGDRMIAQYPAISTI